VLRGDGALGGGDSVLDEDLVAVVVEGLRVPVDEGTDSGGDSGREVVDDIAGGSRHVAVRGVSGQRKKSKWGWDVPFVLIDPSYIGRACGVSIFKLPYRFIRKYIPLIDPLVLRVGIALVFHKVLQFPSSAESPNVDDLFDFVFFFAVYQIGRRSLVIRTMCRGLLIPREKIRVEHRVNAPLRGKFKAIVDRGHHLNDLKRSMPLGRKLGSRLMRAQMTSF
jgi:hypothetical protein